MTLLRKVRTVIWDFNGTLIDDLDLVLASVNPQLERQGLAAMTAERYRDVFGFPVQDYYRRLGVDFEKVSMTKLAADFFGVYEPGLRDCPLHDGVREALDAFDQNGASQFVLSAMEEGMLRDTLDVLGILDRFAAAYGLAHQEGDSKVSRGRELMKDHSIEPETTVLIGDTDHDAEVAAELGVGVVLIANGHQSGERLGHVGVPVAASIGEAAQTILGDGRREGSHGERRIR